MKEFLIYLGYAYLIFISIKVIVVVLNFFSKPYLKKQAKAAVYIRVSVLIPARNEEKNIEKILTMLLAQTHVPFEIWIYDDVSNDNTARIVSGMAYKNSLIKLIQGRELPNGWLGKNHACYQLAQQAGGDYLLFLDADVLPHNNLIENAISLANSKQIKLLTIFPYQIMNTLGEKLVVPLMHNILLSLLPLFYVKASHRVSLSAANGQFMLFEALTYKKLQPHAWVKNSVVEDIKIMKLYKKFHYSCLTLLGNNTIGCRMYNGFSASVSGFSKNIQAFFGNSTVFMLLYTFIPLLGWVALFYLPNGYLLFGFFLLVFYHILLNAMAGRKFWMLALAPIQTIAAFWVAINSIFKSIHGKLEWKGRLLQKK